MLESKLPATGTSIFSVMSSLAAESEAVNLSQGFPDFDCDPELKALVNHYISNGHNQYAPSTGISSLREQIAAFVRFKYQRSYDPDKEITITSGATEALFCAISAVIREGDEVIIFEPAYDSYVPVIELNGGIPVFLSLDYPDYAIDWEAVKKRITSKTRLIILNSPHNPTGSVLSAADLEALQKIVSGNQIYLISDEVYEHIIFDNLTHQSLAMYEALAERAFIISSFGKSFHITGWKVGYCLAPAALTAEFRKIHQFVTFSVVTPIQFALADFMQNYSLFADLSALYESRRNYFLKLIEGSGFKPLPCRGTYFQLLSYEGLSTSGDKEFSSYLTTHYKIASIPISVFYHSGEDNHVLRFCFAKNESTLEKAAERLHAVKPMPAS